VAAGDVITAVGGTPVTSASALTAALAGSAPDDRVTLTRTDTNGVSHTATVTLATGPAL
jgi:S1-C subfamily serine protease